jgi:hypothetical protein
MDPGRRTVSPYLLRPPRTLEQVRGGCRTIQGEPERVGEPMRKGDDAPAKTGKESIDPSRSACTPDHPGSASTHETTTRSQH